MTIRHATAADTRGIAEVHTASWKTSYRGLVPDFALDQLSVDSCQAAWDKRFGGMRPTECCFVSVNEGGGISGFASAGPAQSSDLETDGELYAIYLLETAQRQGTGRALFYRAVEHLRAAGFRTISLWFLKDNPAGRFYEKFGGRIVAERPWVREGYTLPSLGCKWDDIDALSRALYNKFTT
jgi:GNAT superfamily N-acetyltransferase